VPLSIMSKQTKVGIDIGHHSIKVMQLERTELGWKVAQYASCPTPEDSVLEGNVSKPELVAAALKTLLKENKMTSKLCHVSVASHLAVVRTVKMPKMTEQVLRKSIRFEVGRYIPNSVDDSYVEFEILNEELEGGQMEVMIVACPKDLVNSRVFACQLAGLEVESVDLEPFASHRSLIESDTVYGWGSKTFALLDLGARNTTVSIISNGRFVLTRTIPQGSHTLTEALQGFFKIATGDAEMGKSQLDVSLLLSNEPIDNPPLRVLQPHLDEMLRELRRSLNFAQAQGENADLPPVTHLILSGGGAKLTGLADLLAKKLDLKVLPMGVLDNPRFISVSPDLGAGLDLAVVSGLAMRELMTA